jgi:uncharacterized protein
MEKILKTYNIYIQGLEDKLHEFEFSGENAFFEVFQEEDAFKGSFVAKVKLDKSSSMLQLEFEIEANVELECDRSLETYNETFFIDEKYIFKFGDREEVVSEDMEVIHFGASEINLAQHIFDFIALAIPIKKIHPDLRDEDSGEDEFVFIEEKKVSGSEPKVDPRWEALADLKNKLRDN